MGWTGWVFEMDDGRLFSYGSTFSYEFFQLPDVYGFHDVSAVHNHSYVNANGEICPLERGMPGSIPQDYHRDNILRERPYFVCYVDGI
jgi:hypothetical protein